MRDIKFRAWDSVKRNMMSIGEFPLLHEPDNGLHSGWIANDGDWDSHTLMQYTGLKDKNGVEIYESDVIRWGDSVTEVVTYDNETACFHAESSMLDSCMEVIGNIYENKDLLDD